jgi:hypothetical protein
VKAQLDRCLEELKRLVVVPTSLLGPAVAAVKPPDAEARFNIISLSVTAAVKPPDAEARFNIISLSVTVSVSAS